MYDENESTNNEANNLVNSGVSSVANLGRGVISGINNGLKSSKKKKSNESNIPNKQNQANMNNGSPSTNTNSGNGLENKDDPLDKKNDDKEKDKEKKEQNKTDNQEDKSDKPKKKSSLDDKKSNDDKKQGLLERLKESRKKKNQAVENAKKQGFQKIVAFLVENPYVLVILIAVVLLIIILLLLVPMSGGFVAIKDPGPMCSLRNPIRSMDIKSGYNWRIRNGEAEAHKGVDVAASKGDVVYAMHDGTITEMDYNSERGNYIIIDYGDIKNENATSLYANLLSEDDYDEMNVLKLDDVYVGAHVKKGQRIGYVGDSSSEEGTHLHFELFQRGKNISPNRMFGYDDPIGSCDPTDALDTTKEEIEELSCETLIPLKEGDKLDDYCNECDAPFTIRTELPGIGENEHYNWDGWYSYECAFYAHSRANEILAEIGSDKKWTNAGNAYQFCDHARKLGFEVGDVPRPGSIFVWFGGNSYCSECPYGRYGHVGIVEKVNEDGTIATSDGWNPGEGYSTYIFTYKESSVEVRSGYTLNCYIYLIDNSACRNTNAMGMPITALINIRDPGDETLIPEEIIEYDGADFIPDVLQAYKKMKEAAASDGINLEVNNSWRSVSTAADYSVNSEGLNKEPYSRAGKFMSEHHYGLAIDFAPCCDGFKDAVPHVYDWLQKNAYKYGFIERYTNENVTQYIDEDWHWRYIGIDNAKKYYEENWHSYEEFYCKRIDDSKNTCEHFQWYLND